MELHLHLSVAFRALDRKWGPAVDLDTEESKLTRDRMPCLPAMIERPAITFSSEEYLKKRYRPKPYSRINERRRKRNVKTNDSFADISSSRIPTLGEAEATSIDSGLDQDFRTVTDFIETLESCDSIGNKLGSTETLDSYLEDRRPVSFFKHLKCAKAFIDKTCRRKTKC